MQVCGDTMPQNLQVISDLFIKTQYTWRTSNEKHTDMVKEHGNVRLLAG